MITHEITVWCDRESPPGSGHMCGHWVQFNESEARGLPSRALQEARRRGWRHTKDGKDYCPQHHDQGSAS